MPATPPPCRPTEAELAILAALWQHGPGTVRAVHDALSERGTGINTTLKLLQIMEGKGLVERDLDARPQVWRAREPRERMQRRLLGTLIDKVFGGSAAALVQQALDLDRIDERERAEIRRLLAGKGRP